MSILLNLDIKIRKLKLRLIKFIKIISIIFIKKLL